ncbi:MAG: hypothetical protein ACI8P0_001944 [Planctomycetaceae bacterium]|jgi:hypothetical protein
MRSLGIWGVLVLLPVLSVGCGGGDSLALVSATGTVYYKDQPVSGATVTFRIEGAPLAMGITNSEGKFVMTTGGRPGAPIGNAKVGIAKTSAQEEDLTSMKPEDMQTMQIAQGDSPSEIKSEIPEKFASPDRSELVATLDTDGSMNVFEFRLVD